MSAQFVATRPLVLRLSTAAELMTRDPLSFDMNTPVHKAAAILDFQDLESAPVVDAFGRPVGVVSKAMCADWQEFCVRSTPHGQLSASFDETTVDEIMVPLAETVREDEPVRDVIEKLLGQRPRRVYVVTAEGELVGVVSAADVLRRLLAGDRRRRPLGAGASLLC